jgi:hypothetical protein
LTLISALTIYATNRTDGEFQSTTQHFDFPYNVVHQ